LWIFPEFWWWGMNTYLVFYAYILDQSPY
jgi:hypothetical protein